MTHEDSGHYAGKHPGKQIDETISAKLSSLSDNGIVTCASAHKAAKSLGISPADIGVQIDLLEYRISQCQLGLFGYSPEKKKIDPNIEISKDLTDLLNETKINNCLSCSQCWEIANTLKIKKLDLGSACEKIDIKIRPCQLGAF